MKKIGENIWVHEDTMSVAGFCLGLRTTIIQLADGGLWVHSPTSLSPQLQKDIEALGSVNAIVGASNGHNIWLRQWQDAFPDAQLFVSAGIPKKLKLTSYRVLDDTEDDLWKEDFERQYMAAVPFFNETVFLHKKSKSLIVTDLIQHYADEKPSRFLGYFTKYIFELLGFKGICVAPPLKMSFMIKDKAQFNFFIKSIQSWDFDKIIVTHGEIIETNAKSIFSDLSKRFIQ